MSRVHRCTDCNTIVQLGIQHVCNGLKRDEVTRTAFAMEIAHVMRTEYPMNRHAREWADFIEKRWGRR